MLCNSDFSDSLGAVFHYFHFGNSRFLFQIIPQYTFHVRIVEPEALSRHPPAIRQQISIRRISFFVAIKLVICFLSMRSDMDDRISIFLGKVIFYPLLAFSILCWFNVKYDTIYYGISNPFPTFPDCNIQIVVWHIP